MLDVMITRTADLIQHVLKPGPIPSPNEGEIPPFAEKAQDLLGWAMWGALFCCVAGFIIIGARMGIQHKRGDGGNHMGSMAMVGFGCVLIVSAVSIVTKLT